VYDYGGTKYHWQVIAEELENTLEISMTPRYVNIFCKDIRFKGTKPIYHPEVSPDKRQRRLDYCWVNRDDKFHNVFFVDESAVTLTHKGLTIWYRPGVDPKPVVELGDLFFKLMV